MIKRLALTFALLLVLLLTLVAWRGRGDGRLRATRTPTPSPTLLQPATPAHPQAQPADGCDLSYPNSQTPGTCAYATAQSAVATWTAANCAAGEWINGQLNCLATVAPTWTQAPYP